MYLFGSIIKYVNCINLTPYLLFLFEKIILKIKKGT